MRIGVYNPAWGNTDLSRDADGVMRPLDMSQYDKVVAEFADYLQRVFPN